MLTNGTITITERGADQSARQTDKKNQGVIFKTAHDLKVASRK